MADKSQFAQMPPFLLNMTGGQKIASSLMNCVSHFDYLEKMGYFTELQRNFVEHALYKFPVMDQFQVMYFECDEKVWGSSDSGFKVPSSPLATYVTRVGDMTTRSCSTRVKFDEPVATTFENAAIKVEEMETVFSAHPTTTVIDSPATLLIGESEITSIDTTVNPVSGESEITPIDSPVITSIDAPVTPVIGESEITSIGAPVVLPIDASAAPVVGQSEITSIDEPVNPAVTETELTHLEAPTTSTGSISDAKGVETDDFDAVSEDAVRAFLSKPYDREANRSIYDDPPRAIPPSFFKNTSKARAVTKDSPKKYDNFRQLCGQKGIRISAPKADVPKITAAQFFDSLICAK